MFGALWAIPLAVGIEVLALNRLRDAQDVAARQNRMRDALARLANSAWFVKDADGLLLTARDEARTILRDPSIEGSLRPIARDRFVTELFSSDKVEHAPQARTFLIDLAQIVSAAAERYQLSERLHVTAFADPLTRLPNRRAVEEHLLAMLERANVERTRVSLIYCDLDGFKRVNDSFGHAHGDALLVRVSDYLRHALTGVRLLRRAGRRRRVRHRARPRTSGRRPGRHRAVHPRRVHRPQRREPARAPHGRRRHLAAR